MGSKRKRGGKEGAGATANTSKKAKKSENTTTSVQALAAPKFETIPFVETPTGEDRRREANLYEKLGSEDDDERMKAAECIISSLVGEESVPEAVLQRHLDRRLFRGLASGRNASRLGFSIVITELIRQLYGPNGLATTKYEGLDFEKVLGFLVDKTRAVGNIPGQEERDYYFGQLFGIECFVRSGILFIENLRWQSVLQLLLGLAYQKVWLRPQCGWMILEALGQMGKSQDVRETLEKVSDAGLAKTPEGVALWIIALRKRPDLDVKPWAHPLSKKSLTDLTAVLKESVKNQGSEEADRSRGKNKTASWSAQLHFVWDIILENFTSKQDTTDAGDFEQFWLRVVDDGLFSKSATDGQKFKGFMVFQKFLSVLTAHDSMLECLFSKNLTACLMNQAAKEDRYLHRAATKTLKAIETTVASSPATLKPVLRSLLSVNGAYNFDQRTNSKTIDKLLQNVNATNEAACFQILQHPLPGLVKQEEAEGLNVLRTYVDYLAKSLNAPSLSSSDREAYEKSSGLALKELARLAYSQPEDIPQNLLTDQIKELCRSRLESSFAKLIRWSDDFGIFCDAVGAIDISSVSMPEEMRTSLEEATSRMRKLLRRKAKSDTDKSLSQGLAMLHAVSIFQLYNEESDAMETLQDLAQYSDRLKKGKAKDDKGGDSELLVEILLAMVARPSSLMRQVSQQVFDAFTSQISPDGLDLLIGPLSSSENAKGQQELFNTEEDDMDVDEEGSSDDEDVENASDVEIASDVEFVDLDEEKAEDDSDEEGEDDEESGTDGKADKSKGDAERVELDIPLSEILKSHRLDKDVDAESSEDDIDMSDSEMLALDDKLAEVFKHKAHDRPDSKKQKKNAKDSVVNFKHRILDLLDIFVKNEPLSPLTFSILVPLLHLMRTTSTKVLGTRACEIILNYQKGSKKARGNKEDAAHIAETEDALLPLLVDVHEEAGKDNAHAYTKAASAASLVVASALFSVDKDGVKKIAAIYAKTQSEWVLGEAKLQPSFFTDWNNWCQAQASQSST